MLIPAESVCAPPSSPAWAPNEVLEIPRKLHPAPHSQRQPKTSPPSTFVFMSQAAMTRAMPSSPSRASSPQRASPSPMWANASQSPCPPRPSTLKCPRSGSAPPSTATPSQKLYEKIVFTPRIPHLHRKPCPSSKPLSTPAHHSPLTPEQPPLVTDRAHQTSKPANASSPWHRTHPKDCARKMLFFQNEATLVAQDVLRRRNNLQRRWPLRVQLENNTHFDADDRTNLQSDRLHPPLQRRTHHRHHSSGSMSMSPHITTTRVFNIQQPMFTDVCEHSSTRSSPAISSARCQQAGGRHSPLHCRPPRAAAQRTGPQRAPNNPKGSTAKPPRRSPPCN